MKYSPSYYLYCHVLPYTLIQGAGPQAYTVDQITMWFQSWPEVVQLEALHSVNREHLKRCSPFVEVEF